MSIEKRTNNAIHGVLAREILVRGYLRDKGSLLVKQSLSHEKKAIVAEAVGSQAGGLVTSQGVEITPRHQESFAREPLNFEEE